MTESKSSVKLQSLISGLLQALRQAQDAENAAAAKAGANPSGSLIQAGGLMIADAQFEIACEILQPRESELKNSAVPEVRIRLPRAPSGKPTEQVASKIRVRLVSNTLWADDNADQLTTQERFNNASIEKPV